MECDVVFFSDRKSLKILSVEFLPFEIKQHHQRKEERCVTTQKTATEQTTGKSFITPYPTCAIIFARHQTRQTGNLRYQLGEAHKCYYPVEEQ